MTPCYLFDIDGTLADLTHRLSHIQKEPKDWDAFFSACAADTPIPAICALAQIIHWGCQEYCGEDPLNPPVVVFVSGRSDRVRKQTMEWLARHIGINDPLYMRADGDHRPDYVVKAELLDRIIAHGFKPIMAFDDRDQVVKMWRERGIPCAQVAPGDF